MKNQTQQRVFVFVFIFTLCFSMVSSALATTLTLTPNTGPTGTTVTAKGSGYTPSGNINQTNNSQTGTSNANTGLILVNNFRGLGAGATITKLQLYVQASGSGQFLSLQNFNTGHSDVNGSVFVNKFTGLQPGATINLLQLNVQATGGGNIRVKAFDDTGGAGCGSTCPGALIGESGSQVIAGTGVQNFTISATVPANGNVWFGFEGNSGTTQLFWQLAVTGSYGVAHTYGTGPNPFGVAVSRGATFYEGLYYTDPTPHVRIKAYQDNGTIGCGTVCPKTLLQESASQTIPGPGLQNFTIPNTTVPASGNIWIGFEVDSINTNLYWSLGNVGTWDVAHTYGTGPNPFGVAVSRGATFFERVYYTTGGNPISIYFNGVLVPTVPALPNPNGTGGFCCVTFSAGPGTPGNYQVKANDTFGLHATTTFTLVVIPYFPYVTTLHYTTISNNSTILVWSTPNLSGFVFHGYRINYTSPYGIPNSIVVNNTNSSTTNYGIQGLSSNTQYSFRIGTWANSTNYASGSNILDVTTLTSATPNLTPGSLNLNVGTNPLHVPFEFHRIDTSPTTLNLIVNYPNSYNTTCNFNYQFANTNRSYYNLATVPSGLNRVNSTFQFTGVGNDIVNVICRDVVTNNTGHYALTQAIDQIPMVQQIHTFENGGFGTAGQFGAFDFIELIVLILSMIALNQVDQKVGAIIMIIVIGVLGFFHIGSLPVIIFSAIAMVLVLIVGGRKQG